MSKFSGARASPSRVVQRLFRIAKRDMKPRADRQSADNTWIDTVEKGRRAVSFEIVESRAPLQVRAGGANSSQP